MKWNPLQAYRSLKYWYRHVWKQENYFSVPLKTKIKYALRGFNTNEYCWYHLTDENYREYISDYQRRKSRNINGVYKIVLDDKLLFEEIFRHYVRVPAVYAWLSDGMLYSLHGYEVTMKNFSAFLTQKQKTVLKWIRGHEGKGTFVITALEQHQFDVNGEKKTAQEIMKLCSGYGDAILCEYIRQSAFEDALYPDSTNTLRIVCAKKKHEQSARVLKAVQRIGNNTSKPVDNVSQGAISCEVNIHTGELGRCFVAKQHGTWSSGFEIHPDTGVQITGRKIPGWEQLVQEIETLTNRFPWLGFVAWDILLTEEGYCVIEGNASAGCTMFQMEHGIKYEELGDIYRSYGIFK